MDQDYRQLLIGKVQAETRLEILREQLSQANNATQHLLLQLGGSGTQCSSQAHARLEVQCERLLQENAELKAMLRLAERRKLPASRGLKSLEDGEISESTDEGSLMDLGEAESEQLITLRKSKTDHDDMGTTAQLQKTQAAPTTPTAGDTQQQQDPNSDVDLLAPAQATDRTPQPPRAPRPKRLSPGMSEHNRMVSIATWLIDDSEETRFEKWTQMSRNYDFRPVEEYEEYWQRVVRPAYLSREGNASGSAEESAQDEQPSRAVADTKQTVQTPQEPQGTEVQEPALMAKEVASEEDVAARTESLQANIVSVAQDAATETKHNAQPDDSVQKEEIPPPTRNCSFETKTEDRRDSVLDSSFESTNTIFTSSTSTDAATTDGEIVPQASIAPGDGQGRASLGLMESMHAGPPRQKPVDFSQLPVNDEARETVDMSQDPTTTDNTENSQSKDVPDKVDTLDASETTNSAPAGEVEDLVSQPLTMDEQYQRRLPREPQENSLLQDVRPLEPRDTTVRTASDQNHTDNLRSSSPSRHAHPRDRRSFDPQERRGRSRNHYDASFEAKDLFFIPEAEEDNPHLFRTVIIRNIPTNVNLSQVLDYIRGGKIAKASLMKTAGFKTTPPIDTNTAMITFANGFCAKKFAEHCKAQPIHFTSPTQPRLVQATVNLLLIPTRPLPGYMVRDRDLSRIVYLNIPGEQVYPPEQVLNDILGEINNYPPKIPLNYGYDEDGMLVFEYASMFDAKAAVDAVRRNSMFRMVQSGFLRDPCDIAFGTEVDGAEQVRDEESEQAEEGDSAEG